MNLLGELLHLIRSAAHGVLLPYLSISVHLLIFKHMLLFSWESLLLLDARDDVMPGFGRFVRQLWSCLDQVFDFCIHDVILRYILLSYLYYISVNDLINRFYSCCWVLACLATMLGACTTFGVILDCDNNSNCHRLNFRRMKLGALEHRNLI